MTDQAATEEEVEAKPKKGMSGKKLVLFIVLPILLLAGGGAGAFVAGVFDPLLGVEEELAEEAPVEVAAAEATDGATVFYDLPEMLVNLNVGRRKASYLKISVSLELASESDMEQVDLVLPRIVDSFQVYLRELRVEDLSGSAGLQRLREELLTRVNAATHPIVVGDVLFKEMLVQ